MHIGTIPKALCTGVCLSFSLLVCILTVSKNRDALSDSGGDTLLSRAITAKARITEAFGDGLAGFDRFLNLYGAAERLLGTTVYEDAGYGYLIRDTKDFLHYYTQRQDETPYAEAVIRLRDTLAAADIPFLYLQAPTKERDGYTVFPPGIDYHNDENSDAMLSALRAADVDVLSFREYFASAESPVSDDLLFYRTDHHWTTEAAFAAFGKTVAYLNEKYGYALDTARTDRNNWTALSFSDYFLGSIGRRLGTALAGLDDYTFLEPAFDTAGQYTVYNPAYAEDVPYRAGSFHEALVVDSVLYGEDVESNRYASYFQWDYGQLYIDNADAGNDLHITIIKDSFALPFTAFLSTTVAHIEMIDLREYEGNLTEHLLAEQPDLVMILYGNGSFSAGMYAFDGETEG